MRPEALVAIAPDRAASWRAALVKLGLAWAALFVVTLPEWAEMAHQWWDIDTYNHVLLVPGIIAWLVWMRAGELRKVEACGWAPGIAVVAASLALCFAGRTAGLNIVAQAGVIAAFSGAVISLLGLRAALILAFPLIYAVFLIPFGDELIPALQHFTARMTVSLTHLSGVEATLEGLFIDTPAGKFVVAEECSGVKFLIAMIALATLLAWTGFASWKRRALLLTGAAGAAIIANSVRAWGTIFVAQYVGAERAGGFDHIVYGWVFFGVVIVLVLGTAWRWVEREPQEAGLTANEVAVSCLIRFERHQIGIDAALLAILARMFAFAVAAALV